MSSTTDNKAQLPLLAHGTLKLRDGLEFQNGNVHLLLCRATNERTPSSHIAQTSINNITGTAAVEFELHGTMPTDKGEYIIEALIQLYSNTSQQTKQTEQRPVLVMESGPFTLAGDKPTTVELKRTASRSSQSQKQPKKVRTKAKPITLNSNKPAEVTLEIRRVKRN